MTGAPWNGNNPIVFAEWTKIINNVQHRQRHHGPSPFDKCSEEKNASAQISQVEKGHFSASIIPCWKSKEKI